MANAAHPLLTEASMNLAGLPDYVVNSNPVTGDTSQMTSWNRTGIVMLNGAVTKAILEYVKGAGSEIGAVNIGAGIYAAEMLDPGTATRTICRAYSNGKLHASLIPDGTEVYKATEHLTKSKMDMSPFMMVYLLMAAELDKSQKVQQSLDSAKETYERTGAVGMGDIYILNDAVQSLLSMSETDPANSPLKKIKIENGYIKTLDKDDAATGSFSGEILCGKLPTLIPNAAFSSKKYPATILDAKQRVAAYTSTLNWSDEERMHIPAIEDSFPVPHVAWDIVDDFIGTRGKRLQFSNVGIRGTSGYGKSTICRIVACILQTPFYVVSCFSTMETADFLSRYVPTSAPQVNVSGLPDLENMYMDAEGSYEQITGTYKEEVSREELMKVYNEAVVSQNQQSGTSGYFKRVDSDYIKALSTGAVVELQEYNVIRDRGALKGLNQYDEPGAVIPLVDGSYTTRHENALVIWTANVGYASSVDEEWSVSRRIRTWYDVFDIPKDEAISRIQYNIEDSLPKDLIEKLYDAWEEIKRFVAKRQIHPDLSLVSLENWCSAVSRHGRESIEDYCRKCVISQCSNDSDTQANIWETSAKVALEKSSCI